MTLLHVTNGESAANSLRQTTLGGAVLPWQDVLHEGPVPAVPRPEFLRIRAAFLAGCGWGSTAAIHSSLERRDRQFVDALRAGVRVALWFEHDLYDQLQLVDALVLAPEVGVAPELIVIGSFPGKPAFRGLGELSAAELEMLWPERRQAAPDILTAATAVWDALRAPEPTALAAWAGRDVPLLPFLGPAVRRLLEELPAPGDGLSGTERRALEAIAGGESTPAGAFVASQQREQAPFIGDAWFYRTLAALGRGPTRFVETRDGDPLPQAPVLSDEHSFARLPLRLTDDGQRVLGRTGDRVELAELDRWIGGTHVTRGNVWRWDPRRCELLAGS